MQLIDGHLRLSATDLSGHLGCAHLTALDSEVARGTRAAPDFWNPVLDALRRRGTVHESAYLAHLESGGHEVVRIPGAGIEPEQEQATRDAMRAGAAFISQGVLAQGHWRGRADILRRIATPSALGAWSYEVIDTKLARETRGGSVLQLCLYTDLVAGIQDLVPEYMYVVAPGPDFVPERYRTADFSAYYRLVKARLEAAVAGGAVTYPDPKPHCDICRWRRDCDRRRRDDDHPCLVAGASTLQISELKRPGITTTAALAAMTLPLQWTPSRGAARTYERLREQARVQCVARERKEPYWEPLDPEPGVGLARLPEPSAGDIFLDLEGYPYAGEDGFEHLFGLIVRDGSGTAHYARQWALSHAEERAAFETLIDDIQARRRQHPDLHVFHFGSYEAAALRRLMGRYATREDAVDGMLRAELFVDLHAVVRGGIRAGVESYSLKELEKLHGFGRAVDLADASRALARVQAAMESDDFDGVDPGVRATVEGYNRDDCLSALRLRDWLEDVRAQLIADGTRIDRPAPDAGAPGPAITDWQNMVDALAERLTAGLPEDPAQRDDGQQACWILAHIADWHRREDKPAWWNFFRLSEMPADALIDEQTAVAGLEFVAAVDAGGRPLVHRYRYPAQETDLRDGMSLRSAGGKDFGKLQKISYGSRHVDIAKARKLACSHPPAVFAHDIVPSKTVASALVAVAEHVADRGLQSGTCEAACDILMRRRPRIGAAALQEPGEAAIDAAVRIAPLLRDGGVLPIQGPPGSGKTYTGARMICALIAAGARVGVTANSHKVIRNLIDEVLRAADETGTDLRAVHKISGSEGGCGRLQLTCAYPDFFDALADGCQVGGGTAWAWARTEAQETVDVLFVDEAAQMSLANVLAVSRAAAGLVLLGDPGQLEQPMQGSHPEGTAVSALDHLLAGERTIAADRGLFLDRTWRLHPDICRFTSEAFYEGRLQPRPGLERQRIASSGPLAGSGLRFLPVAHEGNQTSSPEEAEGVAAVVTSLLDEQARWTDRSGTEHPIRLDDILIIAPCNAQVAEIQRLLPGARVGTVDRFQGQEAPIAICSMATSSPADAPHGMEFLYSPNRLNVATSRARCVSLLVANPALLEPECRTPRQMQLANAFCRYQELAQHIRPWHFASPTA